jgi:hypothetical protein
MSDKTKDKEHIPARFGLVALVLGMLALTCSVGHFWLGPIEPPPLLEDSIADQAVKIRDKVIGKLKGVDTPPDVFRKSWDADQVAMATIAGASLLAILLAVVGFVRHEPIRMVGSAAALGGSALALQYLVIAVCAIVCAIILAAVLNGLDFSP